MSKLLFKSGDDWTQELLERVWEEIEIIAKEDLRITYYKPQIEIVSAKQMLDAYTSVGMPTMYKHWSFGKEYVYNEKMYKAGKMGLAYELVINSNPCIAYLMEENDAMMQTLVLAHASVGHSAVFKHNYLFKDKTDADAIIDYLEFARNYIKLCEEKYGEDEVESVLDACHALQNYGVDKYKKPKPLNAAQEEKVALQKFEQELSDYDLVWEKVGKKKVKKEKGPEIDRALKESQENILYFIEKNAPHLPVWKRELIRITRMLAQYFSPQRATKVLNEGFASFTHYFIMNRLYDKGLIDGGTMISFFASHSGVLNQPGYGSFNPYTLGFAIFMDIKRICEGGHWAIRNNDKIWVPITDEDREYFPQLIGKDWVEAVQYAMMNFKDETFIQQYLSPKVARDMQIFVIKDGGITEESFFVTEISNQRSFRELRNKMAAQYAVENIMPDVQVTRADNRGSRKITLKHFVKNNRPLALHDAKQVIQYVADLWEYTVMLETIEHDEEGNLVPLNLSFFGRYSAEAIRK